MTGVGQRSRERRKGRIAGGRCPGGAAFGAAAVGTRRRRLSPKLSPSILACGRALADPARPGRCAVRSCPRDAAPTCRPRRSVLRRTAAWCVAIARIGAAVEPKHTAERQGGALPARSARRRGSRAEPADPPGRLFTGPDDTGARLPSRCRRSRARRRPPADGHAQGIRRRGGRARASGAFCGRRMGRLGTPRPSMAASGPAGPLPADRGQPPGEQAAQAGDNACVVSADHGHAVAWPVTERPTLERSLPDRRLVDMRRSASHSRPGWLVPLAWTDNDGSARRPPAPRPDRRRRRAHRARVGINGRATWSDPPWCEACTDNDSVPPARSGRLPRAGLSATAPGQRSRGQGACDGARAAYAMRHGSARCGPWTDDLWADPSVCTVHAMETRTVAPARPATPPPLSAGARRADDEAGERPRYDGASVATAPIVPLAAQRGRAPPRRTLGPYQLAAQDAWSVPWTSPAPKVPRLGARLQAATMSAPQDNAWRASET